jgi:hypothetical protein
MREIFVGTWRHVIRETEEDFLKNRVYAEAMPNGLPDEALDGIRAALIDKGRKQKS